MNYQIPCPCGQSVTVPETAAGSECACPCGAVVTIPSLRALRSQNPTNSDGPHPAFVLESLLKTGELQKDRVCALCRAANDRFAWVLISCERVRVEDGSRSPLTFAFSYLILGFAGIFLSLIPGRKREIGTERCYRVPICVCETCQPMLDDDRRLRSALDNVGVYAALLARYPNARVGINQS